MFLKYKKGTLDAAVSSGVVVFVFEDKNRPANLPKKPRPEMAPYQSEIDFLIRAGNFKPDYLKELAVPFDDDSWLLLVGLGVEKDLNFKRILEAGATAAQMATKLGLPSLALIVPQVENLAIQSTLELLAEGVLLAGYAQSEYKSEPAPPSPLKTAIFAGEVRGGAGILRRAEVAVKAVCLARRLGDAPPNFMYPHSFAREVQRLAKPLGLKVKIYNEKNLLEEKMGLISAVGQGSQHPPRMVVLSYQGAKARGKPLVLVGKGVTFDSGGLSLKPSSGLVGMKTDMAGAATVLAVTLAAAQLKIPLNLMTVMPLAENMPGGGAFRVGDVLTGRLGKTVEVTNTDAEGRLLLADALAWAGESAPAMMLDVATLTGACAVALGDGCAGLFTDDKDLGAALREAGDRVGEVLWPLPLFSDYDSSLKSETADMVNASLVPKGGAISAALFLRRFVPESVPWAHLDIAGPGRAEKARPGVPVGATGFGVRALLRFLEQKSL